MKYFCVPADFKKETIDKYAELNDRYPDSKVIETYGQITVGDFFESGRSLDLLPKVDIVDLAEYVRYSRERNIDFNYTINAPYMKNREFTEDGVYEVKKFLSTLYGAGVRSLTIALPTLVEIVKSTKYDFKIKGSVICQITNSNKALVYKQMGVDRIVVDESINRDFDALKRIRNTFGDKIEVIINSICHKNCTSRMFHYNQISGDSVEVTSESSINYYPHRCMARRYEDISNILKLSWTRPEDLKYLIAAGVSYFKLQGRHTVLKGDPVRAVECYFNESYDGNLIELLDLFAPTNTFSVYVDNKKLDGFVKIFYENKDFCKDDCENCGYCKGYAQKSIDYEKAKEVFELSNKFYSEYDSFTKLIGSVDYEESNGQTEDISIEFDI